MLYPHMPMEENIAGLQNLALPSPTEDREELEKVLGFLLPTPNGGLDQEPSATN